METKRTGRDLGSLMLALALASGGVAGCAATQKAKVDQAAG